VGRSDYRSSFGTAWGTADGVPLTITLALVDTASGCRPLARAAVYVWQCDRDGRYSMYSQGVAEENYLRGVQESGADGTATFTSTFPGAYGGRWPHIHFAIYESVAAATGGAPPRTTSQIALPEDACQVVYATGGYERSAATLPRLSLAGDGVFRDDEAQHQLGTVTGDVTAGMVVTSTVPVGGP
jgi:protocatechuate 3,4-dioxygenase beta subunit